MYAIKFNPILSLKRPKTDEKILQIFLNSPVTFQDVYHIIPFRQEVFRKKIHNVKSIAHYMCIKRGKSLERED